MSKEDLIMWKAIEKGWTKSDLKRVDKKIRELYTQFNESIPFKDCYELALMLDEPVSYQLEWSLIRLCKNGIIDVFKKDNLYMIDLVDFQSNNNKRRKKKIDGTKLQPNDNSEYIEY